jgi:N-acetylmuramoyl-L-alanine amidase
MRPYVIRQGDHLARLAHRWGFDPEAVWSHPTNAALRARRDNPAILAPGDILHVPSEPPRGERVRPGAEHHFRGDPPRTTVHLRLKRPDGAPLANEAYRVLGAGEPIHGTTDGDGALRFELPLDLETVELHLGSARRPFLVRVGHMDPVAETSGIRKRLRHLGFLTTSIDVDAAALANAVRSFQAWRGIEPTGEIDDATRAALVDAHGS